MRHESYDSEYFTSSSVLLPFHLLSSCDPYHMQENLFVETGTLPGDGLEKDEGASFP